jgi:hypothetical protein
VWESHVYCFDLLYAIERMFVVLFMLVWFFDRMTLILRASLAPSESTL